MSTVAAIQMCSSPSVAENLKNAAKLLAIAADNGAQLAVLPEMFAIMGTDSQSLLQAKEPMGDGKIQTFLAEQASKHHVWMVGGTVPIAGSTPQKIHAACLVYNPQGLCVARYDKMHLFDVVLSETEYYRESENTEAGTQTAVVDTPLGKLGLAVCFDLRFPTLFQDLATQGAEIIAVPAAFTCKTGQAHWTLLMRCRAIDTFCYMIGATQGGIHFNGRQTHGHALIVDPWGHVLDERKEITPGVVFADLDLNYLYQVRKTIPLC